MRMRMGTLLLAVATLAAATTAAAQDDRERARENFNRGVEHFQAERYDQALEAFQEAYRLAPHPTVRVNMANCYEHLQRPLEAIFHFERFLEESGSGANPRQRREVEDALRGLRRQVGDVTLRVAPDGALVRIDDAETRRSPIMGPVRLVAGPHTIEVSLDGYRSERREVRVRGGGEHTVEVSLRRAEADPEPVTSPDPDPVPDPVAGPDPDPVADPAPDPADPAPDPYAAPPPAADDGGGGFHVSTPALIVGGATVALAVGGLASGIVALGANGDFDDAVDRSNDGSLTAAERAEAREDGLDAKDKADRAALVTDILLVTALVGAGVTTYLLLTGSDDDDATAGASDRWLATPAVGRRAGGVVLQRSF